jgi:hypothetical protein
MLETNRQEIIANEKAHKHPVVDHTFNIERKRQIADVQTGCKSRTVLDYSA